MKIIILHHHLRTGGVSQIIKMQLLALLRKDEITKIKILSGTASEIQLPEHEKIELKICKDLNYLENDFPEENYTQQKEILRNFLEFESNGYDLIHVHNINLGKNPLLNAALYELLKKGLFVFNHCHDFAEDGRYKNYAFLKKVLKHLKLPIGDVLYGHFPNRFIGVLSNRDYQILRNAGIATELLHILLNPIFCDAFKNMKTVNKNVICQQIGINPDLPIILYPVRAIRRKNLGEFVLLAALFKGKANFVITRKPENPAELLSYENWVEFSEKYETLACFDAGNKIDFMDLVNVADRMLTTSVQEGFGMSYIEPWCFGKPVVGRDIDGLTDDFRNLGVDFPFLYKQLKIPTRFAGDLKELIADYADYLQDAWALMDLFPPDNLQEEIDKKLTGDFVDFADLNIEQQQQVIQLILKDSTARESLKDLNDLNRLRAHISSKMIEENKNAIFSGLSTETYGDDLYDIYLKLLHGTHKRQAESLIENPLAGQFTRVQDARIILK